MGVNKAVDTRRWVSLCVTLFPNTLRERRQQLPHRFGSVWSMSGDVPQVDEEMRGERWRLHPYQGSAVCERESLCVRGRVSQTDRQTDFG